MNGPLVSDPKLSSHQYVFDAVQERASLYDGDYMEVQGHLKYITKETLCKQKASWHCSCYANVSTSENIKHAQERHEQAMSTRPYQAKKQTNKNQPIKQTKNVDKKRSSNEVN